MSKIRYLLDVNILVALSDADHAHHKMAMRWFNAPGLDWGTCAFSEAGFLRVSANASVGKLTVEQSVALLNSLTAHPGYRYWPITIGWATLAAPFRERIFGHQQITDACLLGLAVREKGVLVTLDKAIHFLAGPKLSKHVLVLG